MPHKKKLFNKKNSQKFLLMTGKPDALNADGECLKNVLVPVSKSHRPGASLLMSNIAALCDAEIREPVVKEPDLVEILDQFEDAEETLDIVSDVNGVTSKLEEISLEKLKKFYESEEYEFEYEDLSDGEEFLSDGIFSDAKNDDYKSEDKLNCPENIQILNERFEKLLSLEYGEDQIGALDDEEIYGYLDPDSERAKEILESEFQDQSKQLILGNYDEDLKSKILALAEESGDEEIIKVVTKEKMEFDCESILSTYSNKYNHPTIIKEEKIQKIKVPANPLRMKKLTKSKLNALANEKDSGEESDDDVSVVTTLSIRPKGETPEQKRERKSLFKEAKRESRILKKENKLAFKEEKKLQISSMLNARRTAGIRLM